MFTRSQVKQLSSEFPIGDPLGGAPFRRRDDPITLTALTVAATAVSVIGAISQGQAQKQASDYNADIATQNATIATQSAADQNAQQDVANRQRLGAIRAQAGGSGGTGDSGSVLDILGDTAAQGELQKQYNTYQGQLTARGYTNTSSLDVAQGDNAVTQSYFKAGSDLLSGGSNAGVNYSKLTRAA